MSIWKNYSLKTWVKFCNGFNIIVWFSVVFVSSCKYIMEDLLIILYSRTNILCTIVLAKFETSFEYSPQFTFIWYWILCKLSIQFNCLSWETQQMHFGVVNVFHSTVHTSLKFIKDKQVVLRWTMQFSYLLAWLSLMFQLSAEPSNLWDIRE